MDVYMGIVVKGKITAYVYGQLECFKPSCDSN